MKDKVYPYKERERVDAHPLLEPSHRLGRLNLVLEADLGLASASASNSVSWSAHNNEEVHSENTDTWVVLDAAKPKNQLLRRIH